jgi:hypothetical protein
MAVGDKVWFTGTTFGGVQSANNGIVQLYYVTDVTDVTCTNTSSGTNLITTTGVANINLLLAVGDQVWFVGTMFGNVNDLLANGLPRAYFVVDIPNTTQFAISDSVDGAPITLSTASGSMTMYVGQFQISQTPGGTPESLSNGSGSMFANYGNNRMAIYTVNIDAEEIITLTLDEQTITDDYVSSSQGQKYAANTLLYRPSTAQQDLVLINWQPLITATTIITGETLFDGGSVAWVDPVDMYNATDELDKYLVFPKTNILV